MSDSPDPDENWYRRHVGRRIERGMNRLIGTVLAGIGFFAGYFSLPPGNAAGEVRWFGLIVAFVLIWLARQCFIARRSVIEEFGDEADFDTRRKR